MAKRNQHVVRHKGGWAVRGAAVDAARAIAQRQQTELFIHERDGRIRERDSYGNDPYPSKA